MSDTERVRGAYDRYPWPPHGGHAGPALPEHLVDAVSGRVPLLRRGARILIAGCGAGGEAAAFAQRHPECEVVGVDLSPRSVELARQHFAGLRFEVADLGRRGLVSELGTFDLISCHAVADYVPDLEALFDNLAAMLAPRGVLYLGVNSAHHSGARIRAAFARLGLPVDGWSEAPDTRAGLRAVHGLLGHEARIAQLPGQAAAFLSADVFPAFSHGLTLDGWLAQASRVGLRLGGSMAALHVLGGVADRDLRLLYDLDRGGLAQLIEGLQQAPALQLLFARKPTARPPWRDPRALDGWTVSVHPHLGREHFPVLDGDWMLRRSLQIGLVGMAPLHVELSAWMLELLRRCDGTRSLGEVRASMARPAHDDHVVAALVRLWQLGLLACARSSQ